MTRLRAEMPASEFRDWIAVDRYEAQLREEAEKNKPKAESATADDEP